MRHWKLWIFIFILGVGGVIGGAMYLQSKDSMPIKAEDMPVKITTPKISEIKPSNIKKKARKSGARFYARLRRTLRRQTNAKINETIQWLKGLRK